MSKTLKQFLKKHKAWKKLYLFAEDMTLEEFLEKCERGDWILWLFAEMNPDSERERVLTVGHCVDTARHLMKDKRSRDAVDAAIAFGEGKISREELDVARAAADGAYNVSYNVVNTFGYTAAKLARADYRDADAEAAFSYYAHMGAYNVACDANAAAHAAYAACKGDGSFAITVATYGTVNTATYTSIDFCAARAAAIKEKQKQTADICRKYLPIELWNQEVL